MGTNRFTNLSTSQFDPLSWEEVSRVPLHKRTQHTAAENAMGELDTNVAKLNSLEQHSDEAKEIQAKYNQRTAELSQKMAETGINQNIISETLKLNSDFKRDFSPTGRAGQIMKADAEMQAIKKNFYAKADKRHSKDRLDKAWNTYRNKLVSKESGYQGYDEDGNIVMPTEQGTVAWMDVDKDIQDHYKAALSDIQSKSSAELDIIDINGIPVLVKKGTTKRVEVNPEQLAAASKELKALYGKKGSDRQRFVDMYDIDVNTDIDNALGKYIKRRVLTDTKTKSGQVLKAPGSGGSTDKDNSQDYGVPQDPVTPVDYEESTKKVNKINAENKKLESSTLPSAASNLAKNKAKLRREENKRFDANKAWDATGEAKALNEQVAQATAKFQELEQEMLAEIAEVSGVTLAEATAYANSTLDSNGNKVQLTEEGRWLVDRLWSAREGADPTTVADVGGDRDKYYDKFNEMANLRGGTMELETKKTEFLNNYMLSHSKQNTDIVTWYDKVADKNLFNANVLDGLRVDGFDSNMSIDSRIMDTNNKGAYDKSQYGGGKGAEVVNKSIFKALTSKELSSNHLITFGSDGDVPYLSLTATPKEDYDIDTPYFGDDDVRDFTLTKGVDATMRIPLLDTVEGITGLSSLATAMLKGSSLTQESKDRLFNQLITAAVVPTRNPNELGDSPATVNLLSDTFKNKMKAGSYNDTKGIDLLKNDDETLTMYRVPNEGSPTPVLVKDVFSYESIKADPNTQQFIKKSGLLPAYMKTIGKQTVGQLIDKMEATAGDTPTGYQKHLLNYLTTLGGVSRSALLSQFFRFTDETGARDTKGVTSTDKGNYTTDYAIPSNIDRETAADLFIAYIADSELKLNTTGDLVAYSKLR